MNSLDVLQVNKLYHPVIGGVEAVVRRLAEGFAERGHGSRVLVASQRGRYTRETLASVDVRRVGSLGMAWSVPLAPTFPVSFARAVRDADVVHYHLPNPLGVLSHYFVRPSTPTVVTYHSDIVRQTAALGVYRPIRDRMLADADRIVTTSPCLRSESSALQPYAKKTDVIPIGVDLGSIDHTESRSVPIEPDRPIVLCVGRLNYYKGVEYLVRAAAAIGVDATFVVVGDGPRREHIESIVASLGIVDRVRFTGSVDDETLSSWYAVADLFVLPSVEPSEAFGVVQLEAMARSLPVINTDLPTGVPWVSQDGETGLTVPPRDVGALADAITMLLEDDDRRRSLGLAARRRVEDHFRAATMIEDTLELYETII